MSLLPFFKQPTPRRFDHKPIYYDKQAEERKERYERIKQQLEMEEAEKKALNGETPEVNRASLTASQQHDRFEKNIRGSFRQNIPGGSSRDRLAKTNRTVMFIFAVLLLIAFALIWKLS